MRACGRFIDTEAEVDEDLSDDDEAELDNEYDRLVIFVQNAARHPYQLVNAWLMLWFYRILISSPEQRLPTSLFGDLANANNNKKLCLASQSGQLRQ